MGKPAHPLVHTRDMKQPGIPYLQFLDPPLEGVGNLKGGGDHMRPGVGVGYHLLGHNWNASYVLISTLKFKTVQAASLYFFMQLDCFRSLPVCRMPTGHFRSTGTISHTFRKSLSGTRDSPQGTGKQIIQSLIGKVG